MAQHCNDCGHTWPPQPPHNPPQPPVRLDNPTPAPTHRTTPLEQQKPSDWLQTNYDWPAELQAAGWTLHHQQGADTYWTRPGKPTRDGHSAVLHNNTGPLVVWTTELPATLTGTPTTDGSGLKVSAANFHTHYRHNGDWQAAMRDIGHRMPTPVMPSTPRKPPPAGIDPETGEILTDGHTDGTDGDEVDWDTSYQPVDLAPYITGDITQPAPTMLWRQSNNPTALIYPGAINGFHGDSGTGKSWLAVLLLHERITHNENVMLIDLEDTPGSIISRLQLLGTTSTQIIDHLTYIAPTDEFTEHHTAQLLHHIHTRNITTVIIDSLGEAFGLQGSNEDKDAEVGPWLRNVARPLADAGPAVVLIDHSTKNNDNPLHPSGSKRKRAAIGGASYLVEAVTPFTKGADGRLRIKCAKDRHGTYRRGDHIAWLDMTTHPDGNITLELLAPADDSPKLDDTERLRRRIANILANAGQPLTQKALRAAVRSNQRASQQAIDDAVELMKLDGLVVETHGERGARMFDLGDQDRTA